MKKLYKVTNNATTFFIADVDNPNPGFENWTKDQILHDCAELAISQQISLRKSYRPVMKISEIQSLRDLSSDELHSGEFVWGVPSSSVGVDEFVTPKSWFQTHQPKMLLEDEIKKQEQALEEMKKDLDNLKMRQIYT